MSSTSQTWHLKTIRQTSLSATKYLIEHSPADKIVVVVGGFVEVTTVKWSDPTLSGLITRKRTVTPNIALYSCSC